MSGAPTCRRCQASADGACDTRCKATGKATGVRCLNHVKTGGTVCRKHGGRAPQVIAGQKRRAVEIEARGQAARLGVPVDVDQGEALLQLVRTAAGNVRFYEGLVAQLVVPNAERQFDDDGEPLTDEATVDGELYGRIKPDTYEAKPHVLVVLYNDERDRLASYATMALKAGIDERRVRMAEHETERLYGAVVDGLEAAGLTPAQREAFNGRFAARLRTD